MKKYKVAVVGATGAVGQEMLKMLESRNFPVESLRLLASERSSGKKMVFKGKEIPVEVLSAETAKGHEIALFSAGAAISKEYAPVFAKNNCFVIDNSSAWRMEPDIPLVVPEVNSSALSKDKKIIANPNCSTIQMVVVLKPLHDISKIKRVVVATYQAVSGAGGRAMEELNAEAVAWAKNEPMPKPAKFPYQIAFNLIPQIDIFLENSYTKEEIKMVNETKKIMGDDSIRVSATCVRVPVFRAHSEAVWIETENKISPEKAREALLKAKGVKVQDDPSNKIYPMPLDAANQQVTFVGRIREDISTDNGLAFWVVSDNLLKGAALNAVEIAEALIERKII
ncbi:MAG TPA: aspartate-semialdehyde dehydrogenase [Elusimicrobia bacterium]|nr:MAG: aspartate-semialdehyde dehydrogenase [Elusimicrobia bacterium RIFOXYA12_FULL_49_49]OGS08912.1 MAG: aspartate-semialdehyde dehydrogenase [Elusimicrobia bacterium RIFOXYA1_FULL_47_7]OGS09506.1 MAG: aspartate-semialdehyde dehydrogenase [Elusimicrobia bacterium RIFOXYB1_FULL_48_9]OGS15283.1 MAG: aspartate-semialdehyde dehydrogenase [Elusimicrobia bacterium RIFOXYA2_FULL_47_53]OGS26563.1 MAG: aspartate-semialdehyde dehydrogenase [Elusimicrobia bacterium RIFOXYB12_FULL_50_12]OGS30538.1 MAG: 